MPIYDSNATNENDETRVDDSLNSGGVDGIISLTTTPVEGKVSGSVLANRKYVVFQALDKNVKWGFSNTTQSFDLFKNQIIMVPLGQETAIWFKTSTGSSSVSFAEIA